MAFRASAVSDQKAFCHDRGARSPVGAGQVQLFVAVRLVVRLAVPMGFVLLYSEIRGGLLQMLDIVKGGLVL